MVFKRVWDSSCPHVYETWEADGKTWVIQDLPPEDDDKARKILVEYLAGDEPLCVQSNFMNDPLSVEEVSVFWRDSLKQRTSLACYMEQNGQRTLVALNCCTVSLKDDNHHLEINGKAWKNVFGVIDLMETTRDAFEHLGVDKLLFAMGLVVVREYRGAKLGGRLLNAREPLCKLLGIKATATVFTAPASQNLANRCGFTTLYEATWTDFADAGLDFPRNNNVVKYMYKKYQ